VINGQFQYQYALLAATSSVLMVNLFIIINALLPGSQGFILSTENTLLVAGLEIILMAGVWWGSLKASHKVAGPVYAIVQQMEKLAEGDLTARVRLRKKDMFKLEAVTINQCIEELQEHLLDVKKIAQELESHEAGIDENKITAAESDVCRTLIRQLNQKLSTFNLH
jgi:methyl-accepting chemotaxis protein